MIYDLSRRGDAEIHRSSHPDDESVIHHSTRQQAIADRLLIDVTSNLESNGFQIPTAVTIGLWERFIEPKKVVRALGQTEQARLRDVLDLLRAEIGRCRTAGQPSNRIAFHVTFLMTPGRSATIRLTAVYGPDDTGEAALTIMLDGED